MPLGIFGMNAAAVRPYIARGYRLILMSVDTLLLGQAARELLWHAVKDVGQPQSEIGEISLLVKGLNDLHKEARHSELGAHG